MLNPEYLDTSRQYVKEGMSAHDLAQRIVAKAKKPNNKVAKKKEVKKIMKKAGMKLSKMKLRNKKTRRISKRRPGRQVCSRCQRAKYQLQQFLRNLNKNHNNMINTLMFCSCGSNGYLRDVLIGSIINSNSNNNIISNSSSSGNSSSSN